MTTITTWLRCYYSRADIINVVPGPYGHSGVSSQNERPKEKSREGELRCGVEPYSHFCATPLAGAFSAAPRKGKKPLERLWPRTNGSPLLAFGRMPSAVLHLWLLCSLHQLSVTVTVLAGPLVSWARMQSQ